MTLLLTVTGRDHPGVTAALFDVLAERGAVLDDVEQVVVHGQLLLGVVVSGEGDGAPLRAAVTARAAPAARARAAPARGQRPRPW